MRAIDYFSILSLLFQLNTFLFGEWTIPLDTISINRMENGIPCAVVVAVCVYSVCWFHAQRMVKNVWLSAYGISVVSPHPYMHWSILMNGYLTARRFGGIVSINRYAVGGDENWCLNDGLLSLRPKRFAKERRIFSHFSIFNFVETKYSFMHLFISTTIAIKDNYIQICWCWTDENGWC